MNRRTKQYFNVLDQVRIENPCPIGRAILQEGVKSTFCDSCQKPVHHLPNLTRKEAARIFAKSKGRPCVTILRNRDGTLKFREPPPSAPARWATGWALSLFALVPKNEAAAEPPRCAVHDVDGRVSSARESSLEDPASPGGHTLWELIDPIDTAAAQGGAIGGSIAELDVELVSYGHSRLPGRRIQELFSYLVLSSSAAGLFWLLLAQRWRGKRARLGDAAETAPPGPGPEGDGQEDPEA